MNEIKPVTIPREVADAIEFFREGGANDAYSNEQIAYGVLFPSSVGLEAQALRKIPFDTLMRALLDGYERELTEEERTYSEIAKFYGYCNVGPSYERLSGCAHGIKWTLDTLGIKIPEVNA